MSKEWLEWLELSGLLFLLFASQEFFKNIEDNRRDKR